MKKPIAISLSPNVDSTDVRTAVGVLVNPGSWKDTTRLTEAQHRLGAFLPGRHVVMTSSGRQALYDALRVYGIGAGDEVIIQAFTCIAVPESIIWTGAKPVYADIDANTYNATLESMQEKVTPATRAIIIQHTFGIPGAIDEVVAFAHERNIVVIEDCAHSLGTTIGGRAVGTLGDVAIVSFGRDKMISSVFGGAAVFADPTMAERAQTLTNGRAYPPKTWVVQQLLHPILFSGILPTYFMGIGKVLLVLAQKMRLLSRAVERSERGGAMPTHVQWRYSPALAQLLLRQLDLFPQRLARRRAIARRYRAALINTEAYLARVPDNTEPSWLRFPIQVANRTAILEKARAESMLLGDWYDAPLVPAKSVLSAFHYSIGMCPVAESVAEHVVNLPTYPKLTDEQVERVIRIFMESHE